MPPEQTMKDHITRFVEENFEVDPAGFCSHGALLRCYQDWCAAHDIVHRKLPLLVLLLELEKRFRAKARLTYVDAVQSRTLMGASVRADGRRPARVYVICGLRFRHVALNERTSPDANVPPARIWKRVASGSVLDRIEAPELPNPFAEESESDDYIEDEHRQADRHDYYLENRDRILARKKRQRSST